MRYRAGKSRLLPDRKGGRIKQPKDDGLTKLSFTKAPDSVIKKTAQDFKIGFDDSEIGWRGKIWDALYSRLDKDELLALAKQILPKEATK